MGSEIWRFLRFQCCFKSRILYTIVWGSSPKELVNEKDSRIQGVRGSRVRVVGVGVISMVVMNHNSRCLEKNAYKGFTLLEVMFAVSIIAIVLTAVYRMHSQTIFMKNDIRFYTIAPLLAQSKLAEIEMETFKEKTNDAGDCGDDFPNFSWSLSVDDVASEALGDTAEDLKKVDLIISFNRGEKTYSLRTYRFVVDGDK